MLRDYDVSVDIFSREAGPEVVRTLLPGRGPDARSLAAACVRSIGSDPANPRHGALVVALEAFLGHLTE